MIGAVRIDGGKILTDDRVTVYGVFTGQIYSDIPVVSAYIIYPTGAYTVSELVEESRR